MLFSDGERVYPSLAMEALRARPGLDREQAMFLDFALAKALDELRRSHPLAPTLPLIRRLLDHGDWTSDQDFRLFYNINFPPSGAGGGRGAGCLMRVDVLRPLQAV